MRLELDSVLGLPRRGVVAFLDNGSVKVTYTEQMGGLLDLLYLEHRAKTGTVIEIWSAGADLETLRLHAEFFKEHYRSLGYRVIPSYRKFVQYRVRVIPGQDFKTSDVELVSARGSGRVVGKFRTDREARDFIETYYGDDNPLRLPVYAVNSATKEFVLEKQTKMLELR